ncbi:MAG: BatA domain-containing protein [Prolixibacteraceae bacterium]|jgi:hypothetical protein|nr:BatA domain-containing protein [Prolixibacteraceae bacterium]
MKFIYPLFLFALLAVVVPLAIHFFNFKRYKTVYFSNVNFLKAVKRETRKKSKIKQIVILFSRILAIGFLVFTFSQPYIPLTERGKQRARQAVAIYIDNSFSMRIEGEKGILLEQARNKAIEIAASYRPGTRFLLLTNDFLSQHRYLLSKEQLALQLGELKASPNAVRFAQVMEHARQQLNEAGKRSDQTVYVLSDFQKNNFDFTGLQNDTARWTYLMPFSSGKVNNLFIDSCWFEVPGRKAGQVEKLLVHVVNSSDEDYQNIPLRLQINDSLKAVSTLNIGAGEEQTVEMTFTNNSSGFQYGVVELDDYPMLYDNSYFIAYEVKNKVNVTGIFEDGDPAAGYFHALFSDDEFVDYEEARASSLQISRIKNAQCVFLINLENISSGLTDELARFVENGGTLAVFPGNNADLSQYNQLFLALQANMITGKDTGTIHLSEINYNDVLFRNVFKKKEQEANLPTVQNIFSFTKKNTFAETTLMTLRSGQPALTGHSFGKGKLYTFAFPADTKNSSFLKHLIFVPPVYNIAMNSLSAQAIAHPVEIENRLLVNRSKLAGGDGQLIFRKRNTTEEFLPVGKPAGDRMLQVNLRNVVSTAGHYELLSNSQVAEAVAFNYKRNESEPDFYRAEELEMLIREKGLKQFDLIDSTDQNLQQTLQDLNNGKQLWPYFLMAALFFVLLETLIIRFWE